MTSLFSNLELAENCSFFAFVIAFICSSSNVHSQTDFSPTVSIGLVALAPGSLT